jgi:hypothetical protein
MKLIHQIKHKIYNDISHQLDQKETREKIFNILIIPIIKFLKTDITQKYLFDINCYYICIKIEYKIKINT